MSRIKLFLIGIIVLFSIQCQRSPEQEEQLVTINFGFQNKDGKVTTSELPPGFFCYALAIDFETEPIVSFTKHCNVGGSTFPKITSFYGPFTENEVAQITIPTGTHEFYVFATANSSFCQPGSTLTSPDFTSSSANMLLEASVVEVSSGENDITLTLPLNSGLILNQCANGVGGINNISDTPFNNPD